MGFAITLNAYCDSLGCTNKELAESCGISASSVSRYRSGDRTPEIGGVAIARLARGITALYRKNGLVGAPSSFEVSRALERSITDEREQGFALCARIDAAMSGLGIRNSELASAVGIDPSYLSRIRSKQRIPADQVGFSRKCARFMAVRCLSEDARPALETLIQGYDGQKVTEDELSQIIERWLVQPS